MRYQIGPAFRVTLFMTILTGLIYPGIVTGFCQLLFPHRANGSLVDVDGKVAGSALIGQNFSKPEYFHPRPSAAGNDGYDASASNASNYGPTNQKLIDRVKGDIAKFRQREPWLPRPHTGGLGHRLRQRFGSRHQSRLCLGPGPARRRGPRHHRRSDSSS